MWSFDMYLKPILCGVVFTCGFHLWTIVFNIVCVCVCACVCAKTVHVCWSVPGPLNNGYWPANADDGVGFCVPGRYHLEHTNLVPLWRFHKPLRADDILNLQDSLCGLCHYARGTHCCWNYDGSSGFHAAAP